MAASGDEFLNALMDALNYLYDYKRLKLSPLIGMLGIIDDHNAASQLQQTLLAVIRSMQPPAAESNVSAAYRNFSVLSLRYEQQYSQKEIARQLGLSVRQYRRAQTAAVGALSVRLWDQYHLADRHPDKDLHEKAAQNIGGDPALNSNHIPAELAWVNELSFEEKSDLDDVMQTAKKLVETLADVKKVTVSYQPQEKHPQLIIHPMALRHILLDLLNISILNCGSGGLTITTTTGIDSVTVHFPIYHVTQDPLLVYPNLSLTGKLAALSGSHLSCDQVQGNWTAHVRFPLVEHLPVVVVDDIEDTLQLLRRYCSGTSYRLYTTRDPRKVHGLISEHHPRVVVMDIMMPEMDGWDLLTTLKADPQTRGIPVLVCSVLNLRELAITLGASEFLQKPLVRADLLETLGRLVSLPQT
jgi:CheY-like chemotaxis protein